MRSAPVVHWRSFDLPSLVGQLRRWSTFGQKSLDKQRGRGSHLRVPRPRGEPTGSGLLDRPTSRWNSARRRDRRNGRLGHRGSLCSEPTDAVGTIGRLDPDIELSETRLRVKQATTVVWLDSDEAHRGRVGRLCRGHARAQHKARRRLGQVVHHVGHPFLCSQLAARRAVGIRFPLGPLQVSCRRRPQATEIAALYGSFPDIYVVGPYGRSAAKPFGRLTRRRRRRGATNSPADDNAD